MVHRQRFAFYNDAVTIQYPWNDTVNHYSGIPPTTAIMQNMESIKNKQDGMGDVVEVRVRRVIHNEGIAAGHVTPHNMRTMLDELRQELRVEQRRDNAPQEEHLPVVLNRAEIATAYSFYFYLGSFKRVPLDWRFPRCSVDSLWRQWWIGNLVRKIPPLRFLEILDVKHSEDELHGRKGPNRLQRQSTSKTLSDLKYVMGHVRRNVEERG